MDELQVGIKLISAVLLAVAIALGRRRYNRKDKDQQGRAENSGADWI